MIEHDGVIHIERPSTCARNPTGRLREKQMRNELSEKVEEDRKNKELKKSELFAESTVEVEGGADECEMGKGLRKVSKGFAVMTRFFSK